VDPRENIVDAIMIGWEGVDWINLIHDRGR
jgi:hypothetical protein